MEKNNPLKIKNFKDVNGNLKKIEDISVDMKSAYIFGNLMQRVIQLLEVVVPVDDRSDRIFNRARYSVMEAFNEAFAEMKKFEEGK